MPVEQDAAGFEAAVHDPLLMGIVEGRCYRHEKTHQHGGRREMPGVNRCMDVVGKRLTFDILQHEISFVGWRYASLRSMNLQRLQYIRVVQGNDALRLARKLRQRIAGGLCIKRDNMDEDIAAHPGVEGRPDLAHSIADNALLEFVLAELTAIQAHTKPPCISGARACGAYLLYQV